MPITASTSSSGASDTAARGNIGTEKRRNPYVPIFSSTPANTTDPAVGACVCASGSHVWNGKSGILTAKPTANARNNHFEVEYAIEPCVDAHAVRMRESNVSA